MAQFESVAKSRATESGEWTYVVGNRITGKMRFVYVSYTPSGFIPRLISDSGSMALPGKNAIAEIPIKSPYVVAPEGMVGTPINAVATVWATSTSATDAENQQFAGIVHAASTRIIVQAPNNIIGFDSLSGAQLEVVGPYLSGMMTLSSPGWEGSAMTDGLRTVLYRAIGWTQGKGPAACLVFVNGDFGCFQLNPADPNAPVYIEGTGKDRSGRPINRAPSLPNGGGISTKVVYDSGDTGYGANGSSQSGGQWLFCTFIGGKLDHCVLRYVAE